VLKLDENAFTARIVKGVARREPARRQARVVASAREQSKDDSPCSRQQFAK
jgi:hypothetical protein